MKLLLKYCIIFLVCLMGFSCHKKDKNEIEQDNIKSFVETVSFPAKTQWIVVLPGLGCHGCIQEGEQFVKDNINNRKIYFILTQIQSIKILQNKIGIKLGGYKNLYVDNSNKFHLGTSNSIYPCIIKVENNELEDHQFQCPENSQAFFALQTRLKNE